MRILSPFHDFYDGAAAAFPDATPIFHRQTVVLTAHQPYGREGIWELLTNAHEAGRRSHWKRSDIAVTSPMADLFKRASMAPYNMSQRFYDEEKRIVQRQARACMLFVCGQVIPLFWEGDLSDWSGKPRALITMSPEDWLKSHGFKVPKPHRYYRRARRRDRYEFTETELALWAACLPKEAGPELFIAFGSPIFLMRCTGSTDVRIDISPNLRDLGFLYTDPYRLVQQIDMYLGNEMARQVDPVPERTQELIRDAHGFDDRSFKNMPRRE